MRVSITALMGLVLMVMPAAAEPPTNDTLFHYPGYVTSVYDGDTLTGSFDVGISGLWMDGAKLRLARIDAWEVRGEERELGLVARDFLRELVQGESVIIKHLYEQKDPWGRLIVEVWVGDINLSDEMVKQGHAVFKDY